MLEAEIIAFEPKDVAALAVFWLAGVVTCEGIFQVSKEGRAAVVLPAATHPYSLCSQQPTNPRKSLTNPKKIIDKSSGFASGNSSVLSLCSQQPTNPRK